jgi:hypothetical protein
VLLITFRAVVCYRFLRRRRSRVPFPPNCSGWRDRLSFDTGGLVGLLAASWCERWDDVRVWWIFCFGRCRTMPGRWSPYKVTYYMVRRSELFGWRLWQSSVFITRMHKSYVPWSNLPNMTRMSRCVGFWEYTWKKLHGWNLRYSALNSQRKYYVGAKLSNWDRFIYTVCFPWDLRFLKYTLNMDPTPASNGPVIAGYFVNW